MIKDNMKMIKEIENYAEEYNVPIMLPDGIDFLLDYIRNNNIKTILEIGTAIGYSAIRMALLNSNIKVTTIERDKERYEEAVKNVCKFSLNNQINIIYSDAFDINLDDKYDLIFIDAAKSQYIKFFEKFKHNLNKNGVIISDNLEFHGLVENKNHVELSRNLRGLVRKLNEYIDFLKNNEEFVTTFYPVGDGIGISVRNEK